jgi:hypothetical protein
VAEQQGSGAVAVVRGNEEGRALVDFAVHGLKGLMEYVG